MLLGEFRPFEITGNASSFCSKVLLQTECTCNFMGIASPLHNTLRPKYFFANSLSLRSALLLSLRLQTLNFADLSRLDAGLTRSFKSQSISEDLS
mmetsp:Transcript_24857/g.66186  ORF Transcript_24857/g.66186 Transcript_24857/m.66186 type:complete len:95 (-) Transcript_24857:73-357(-)